MRTAVLQSIRLYREGCSPWKRSIVRDGFHLQLGHAAKRSCSLASLVSAAAHMLLLGVYLRSDDTVIGLFSRESLTVLLSAVQPDFALDPCLPDPTECRFLFEMSLITLSSCHRIDFVALYFHLYLHQATVRIIVVPAAWLLPIGNKDQVNPKTNQSDDFRDKLIVLTDPVFWDQNPLVDHPTQI